MARARRSHAGEFAPGDGSATRRRDGTRSIGLSGRLPRAMRTSSPPGSARSDRFARFLRRGAPATGTPFSSGVPTLHADYDQGPVWHNTVWQIRTGTIPSGTSGPAQPGRESLAADHEPRTKQRHDDLSAAPVSPLPTWDLSDLYPSPDAPAVAADSRAPRTWSAASSPPTPASSPPCPAPRLPPRLPNMSASRKPSAACRPTRNCCSPATPPIPAIGQFYQTISEQVTAISSDLIFFTLELNRMDDAVLEAKLGDPALAHYGAPGCATCACSARTSSPTSWRSCCTRRRSPAMPPGAGCSTRRSRPCGSGRRRGPDGQRRAEQAVRPRPRRCARPLARRSARRSATNIRLFSLITNTLAKDKEIERHVAPLPAARQLPQPRQHGRGRGRRRAGHRGAAVLSALVAPLLPDEGEVAGAAEAAALGPQRAAAGATTTG